MEETTICQLHTCLSFVHAARLGTPQEIALIGVIDFACAHKDGQRRPFFRRHRFLFDLIWLIVAPVVGAHL